MTDIELWKERGLSDSQVAFIMLGDALTAATKFRDQLIDYGNKDDFAVDVYDAMLNMLCFHGERLVSILEETPGFGDWSFKPDNLSSRVPEAVGPKT